MNELDQDLLALEHELSAIKPLAISSQLMEQCELQLFGAELVGLRPSALSADQLDTYEYILIESELESLTPRVLDKSFLDQLEHIPEEIGLMELGPEPLSHDLLNKLSHKLENVDEIEAGEGMDDKVIPFPSAPQSTSKNWKWYASAAAVACIGIFCGLSLTNPTTSNGSLASSKPLETFQPELYPISSDNLQNVSTESTFLQAEEKGIVTSQGTSPTHYRAVRVIQMETYIGKNEAGQTIQVQRPVEKTVLMPVEAD